MILFEYVTVPHHLKLNRFIAIKQGWSPWFRMQQLCLLDVMQPDCSNILSKDIKVVRISKNHKKVVRISNSHSSPSGEEHFPRAQETKGFARTLECGVDVQGCGNRSVKLAFQRDITLHLNG